MHKDTLTEAEELPKPFCTVYTRVENVYRHMPKFLKKQLHFAI